MGFFDSFFGKSQQRDLSAARDRATGLVNSGYDRAENYATQGRDSSLSYINPYIESGGRAETAYDDAIGLNGRNALSRSMGDFEAYAAPEQAATQNALTATLRRYNAGNGGGGPSGGLALATARTYADRYGDMRSRWLDRIGGRGQQGFQASQAGAGIQSDYYGRMGDYATGRSGTLAGNEINYGNALAASRGTGINNLLKVGEIGGKIAAAAMGVPPVGGSTGSGSQPSGSYGQYGKSWQPVMTY
jgi:hypothetical protein